MPSTKHARMTATYLLLVLMIGGFLLAPAVATPTPVYADSAVCAVPGRDGPAIDLQGVINTYYPGLGVAAAGATSLSVGTPRGAATPIQPNDVVLIIQVQDATIDFSNSLNYGAGTGTASGATSINNAGLYEYAVATSSVQAGGTLTIRGIGASGGLVNTYTSADATATEGQRRYQVVRVPQFSAASISAVNPLTAAPWDGASGGVLIFDVAGDLNLNGGTATVAGLGFRGGASFQQAGQAGGVFTEFVAPSNQTFNSSKGEGIAGTPRFVYDAATNTIINTTPANADGYPGGSYARGAPGNAGGGGTDGDPLTNRENSGGGGGANGGNGGQGGNTWDTNKPLGGIGGSALPPEPTRLVLGGGGGGGTRNNTPTTTGASGGPGGGIAIIRSGSISGAGTISANGSNGVEAVNDGSGGAGGGGSVIVTAAAGNFPGLVVNARGGAGANNQVGRTAGLSHGPGGGGGGGVVFLSGTPTTAPDVNGGTNGTTLTPAGPSISYGALPGNPGFFRTATPDELSTSISSTRCLPELSIVKQTSTPQVTNTPNGANAVYTIQVSNAAGRGGAVDVTIADPLPAGFTYLSTRALTPSGGAERTAVNDPSPGDTTPTWGTFFLPGGASVEVTFTVAIAASVPDGVYPNIARTTYSTPTRQTPNERTPIDSTPVNVTIDSTQPSIRATKTDILPGTGPLRPGETLRYEIELVNIGRGDALDVVFNDTPDSNTTLIAGTVTVVPSTAVVTRGNSAGDTSVGINIGTIAGNGGKVTISFNVRLNSPIPTTVRQIQNQGQIDGSNIPRTFTDDPETPDDFGDPTRTPIVPGEATAVELRSFTATAESRTAQLRWVTGMEYNSWGFHLYRSVDGTRAQAIRVTPTLIPATGRGQQETVYTWVDTDVQPGARYTYWLQETELDGTQHEYGPTTVSFAATVTNQQSILIPFVVR